MENVIVLFGGKSCEHDISIISALQMIKKIENKNIIPVYIAENSKFYTGKQLLNLEFYTTRKLDKLKQVSILPNENCLYIKVAGKYKKWAKIDFAFVVMHGLNGEDGTVQGLLELANIPYSSCGVLSSACCMDKEIMKKILKSNNLPIVDYFAYTKKDYFINKNDILEEIVSVLEPPYIVKPANLGSSIGISVAKTRQDLIDAIELAFLYDDKIVVEHKIENLKEINISLMGDSDCVELSETEEPINWKTFLTFEDKYLSNGSKGSKNDMSNMKRIIPAKISKQDMALLKALAVKTFKALCCCGLIRIDFLFDLDDKKLYVNEVNAIPGSNAYYLWKDKYSYSQLIDKMEVIGKNKHKSKNEKIYTHESKVIK